MLGLHIRPLSDNSRLLNDVLVSHAEWSKWTTKPERKQQQQQLRQR